MKLLACLAAALLAASCASPSRSLADRQDLRGGRATPDGASFLGFHGPLYRQGEINFIVNKLWTFRAVRNRHHARSTTDASDAADAVV